MFAFWDGFINESTVMLEQKLVDLIDDKARKDEPDGCLGGVKFIIFKLNRYLNGDEDLTLEQRRGLLDLLFGHFTITLDMPIEDIHLIRARKVDQPPLLHYYGKISDMSYMATPTTTLPRLGRLNSAGTALFYASINNTLCDKSLRVTLSEIESNNNDKINVLHSKVSNDLDFKVRYIGIWDYVARNQKPYFLAGYFFDYYRTAFDYMKQQFTPKQFLAYQLCDAFFADVLSRDGNERLYNVTSILGEYFLEGSQIDGIIYTSVKVKGEPVIAISSNSVKSKIIPVKTEAITINQKNGNNFYDYQVTHKATVNGEILKWEVV